LKAPLIIAQLVDKFDRQKNTYTSNQYNESQVRDDFVNPFFKALGWDLSNAQGLSEAYREVVVEENTK
jgi:predicted type IV restriction endonuclease